MRIGQLARRLGISPSDILGFLGNQKIEADAGTNSRLGSDTVVKIITHFAPEKLSEILQTSTEETVVEPVMQSTQVVVEEAPEIAIEAPVAEEQATETEETPVGPVEVIRVAKVELQGLKVLGKIDLPEPKKKEEQTDSEQPEQQVNQPPRREFQRRNDRREREWRNPLEQKRQQEAREAEEKRRENAEKQKEKRANHYYSKVKSVPTKAVRRFEEQTVVEDIEVSESPKGLFGKFLRWLKS